MPADRRASDRIDVTGFTPVTAWALALNSLIAAISIARHSQTVTKLIKIAAALIQDHEGRVLLVRKRGTSVFMQAGGKIDLGETPYEALVRELLGRVDKRLQP